MENYIEDVLEIAYKDYNASSVNFSRRDSDSKTKIEFLRNNETVETKWVEAGVVEQIYKELPVAQMKGRYYEQAFNLRLRRNEKQRLNCVMMGYYSDKNKTAISIVLNGMEKYQEIWPASVPIEVLKLIQSHFGNGFTTGSFMQQVEKWRADHVTYRWER